MATRTLEAASRICKAQIPSIVWERAWPGPLSSLGPQFTLPVHAVRPSNSPAPSHASGSPRFITAVLSVLSARQRHHAPAFACIR